MFMAFGKLKNYLIGFRHILQKQVADEAIRKNPHILIERLREKGVSIDDDVLFSDPLSVSIDTTRPSLVKINGGGRSYIAILKYFHTTLLQEFFLIIIRLLFLRLVKL